MSKDTVASFDSEDVEQIESDAEYWRGLIKGAGWQLIAFTDRYFATFAKGGQTVRVHKSVLEILGVEDGT